MHAGNKVGQQEKINNKSFCETESEGFCSTAEGYCLLDEDFLDCKLFSQ